MNEHLVRLSERLLDGYSGPYYVAASGTAIGSRQRRIVAEECAKTLERELAQMAKDQCAGAEAVAGQ